MKMKQPKHPVNQIFEPLEFAVNDIIKK